MPEPITAENHAAVLDSFAAEVAAARGADAAPRQQAADLLMWLDQRGWLYTYERTCRTTINALRSAMHLVHPDSAGRLAEEVHMIEQGQRD